MGDINIRLDSTFLNIEPVDIRITYHEDGTVHCIDWSPVEFSQLETIYENTEEYDSDDDTDWLPGDDEYDDDDDDTIEADTDDEGV